MNGQQAVKRYETLETQRATWDGFWQTLADYVQTRKSEINTKTYGPDVSKPSFLYDSTATRANMTLAQGQMSLISPLDEIWFEFRPPFEIAEDEEAISYYRSMSDILREELAQSNFYSEIHEMYLQRSGFGTSAIMSSTHEGKLFFKSYDIGTYVICEDNKGFVDTFARKYPLTARQAALEFGIENLPKKIREAAGNPGRCEDSFEFINFIKPRDEFDSTKSAAETMPVESVHVAVEGKHLVKSSGFESFPVHVSRYLRWSDENTDPYGWCPGWTALPDIRQINLLSLYMDVLAESAAYPRVIAPASLEGEVDLRALGITYFDPLTDRTPPQEWATSGRYDIGMDRLDKRQKAIEEAYHVDLFKMFGTLEKQAQMSVREVVERSSEKLIQFSPTFSRLTGEVFSPLLLRAAQLIAAGGGFSHLTTPQSVRNLQGEVFDPKVRYTSRIALAIQSLQNNALLQTLEALVPAAQIDPGAFDVINFETAGRGFARNTGVPENWLRTQFEVEEIQQQRQQLAQQQQEAEIAAEQAKAQQQQ